MRLAPVRGHDRVRQVLARALERDRVPPAMLLAGPDGIGKKTLALALAQAVLCERAPRAEACGECAACRRVAAGVGSLPLLRRRADGRPDEDGWRNFRLHPDLLLVEGWPLTKTGRPRSEPEIRVPQIRDVIDEAFAAPFEARRRVFVIDDAHAMNPQSQNALLKTLEEPSPRAHLVLVSSAPFALLQTIRSRCQTLRFGPLPRGTVAAALAAAGVEPGEAQLRAALAGGSVRAGLDFDSAGYREMRERLLGLLGSLEGLDVAGRMRAAQEMEQFDNPSALLTVLRSLLRDVAAAHAGAAAAALVNADVAERLTVLGRGPLGARAGALAERAAGARRAVRGFANKLLAFDVLVDALAGE